MGLLSMFKFGVLWHVSEKYTLPLQSGIGQHLLCWYKCDRAWGGILMFGLHPFLSIRFQETETRAV